MPCACSCGAALPPPGEVCGAYLGRSCAHRDHQKQDPPNRERGGRVRLGLRVAIARDADAAPACRCPNTALPPLGNSNTDRVPHPPRHTPAALLDRGGRRMARGVRPASENIGPSWNPRPTEADRLPPSVQAAGCRTAFRQLSHIALSHIAKAPSPLSILFCCLRILPRQRRRFRSRGSVVMQTAGQS
jgi:hypothetical protein